MNDQNLLGRELTSELLNERLAGYRVLREVGHGAMGIVFEARQRGLERRVAVKVLPPNLAMRDRTVRRFLREAESMGRLAHTNIVDVYEVGSVGSLHYFAMRFVDGPPLDVVLKAGVLGIGDVVNVGIDVASALAHAHARGVLHRDVKPSNLLRDGERVVLTDFGLAKPIDSDDTDAMTESGDLVGTPLYMSPEQIIGDASGIDARSDVWGLGATLYELLTGRPPFSGGSAQSILHAILHRDPALLHRQRADVPRDLEAVVLKCLEKDRTRRYTGADSLHADLLALQAGRSVSARPPRFVDPALRWSRRHPYQAVGLLIGLGAFGYFTYAMRSGTKKLNITETARKEAVATGDKAREDKMLALASKELLAAVQEWGNSEDAGIQLHALDRVGHLMQAIPVEEYPQVSAEIMRIYASFAKKRKIDESSLTELYPASGPNVTKVTLMMRAAMLEGLEHFDQALVVHKQRAKLSPRAPEPWLDAGNALRQMALLERAGNSQRLPDERLARVYFMQAIAMDDRALELAVRSGNEDTTATVLIERARCLIEIGESARAERNLRDALARDAARADALGLLEACKEDELETKLASAESAPTPATRPVEEALALDAGSRSGKPAAAKTPAESKGLLGLPIVNRLPTTLDLNKQDLTNAGRGLSSIYRGLRDVLRSAASVPHAAETAGGATTPTVPGQQ